MPRKVTLYHFTLKIHFLWLLVFFATQEKVRAQDPVFSQFMFNQMYFNPAFAGTNESPRFTAGYRNQWPGLGNTYVSYYASFDQYMDKIDGGLGFSLNRDNQGDGVFTKTGLDVAYSHPVEISRNLTVNLGLQAGIVQNSINASGLVFPDQNPYQPQSQNEVIPTQSKMYPDFSAGATFYYNGQYQAGLSVEHLNTPVEMNGLANFSKLPVRYTFQLLSQFPAKNGPREDGTMTFSPGFMAQMQKNYVYLNYGSNLQINAFLSGFWIRNDLLFHLNTFTFLAGYAWSGIQLTYSFDLWLPKTYQQLSFYGAHEVTFIYLFKYNDPKKKMKALKCPKF